MPSAIATTLPHEGAIGSKDLIPPNSVRPPATASTAAPPSSAASPTLLNQLPARDLRADSRLEGREALRVRSPVVLDPVAEEREALRPLGEDGVDDLGDRRLERLDRRFDVAERELEIRDLLGLEAAPDLPLGRHRLGAVAAAADQVEQRRRELERTRRAALGEQRRDERGLGLGRRLLLVLAVVATSRARGRRPARPGRSPAAPGRARGRAAARSSAAGCRARRRSSCGRARMPPRRRAPRRRSARAPARTRPASPRST